MSLIRFHRHWVLWYPRDCFAPFRPCGSTPYRNATTPSCAQRSPHSCACPSLRRWTPPRGVRPAGMPSSREDTACITSICVACDNLTKKTGLGGKILPEFCVIKVAKGKAGGFLLLMCCTLAGLIAYRARQQPRGTAIHRLPYARDRCAQGATAEGQSGWEHLGRVRPNGKLDPRSCA